MPKGNALTAEMKQFVIRELAEFQPPQIVCNRFLEEFCRKISVQHVVMYRDSPKWRPEIQRIRKDVLDSLAGLAIASKSWRLQQLQRLYEEADDARKIRGVRIGTDGDGNGVYERTEEKSFADCRELLKQAAEELGELREPVDRQPLDRPRQVLLPGGQSLAPAAAGLPTRSDPDNGS